MKRREAKSKGEKKRYSLLNAEFQRIARRDKKAFLSNQCKQIEANNRMGKTRGLFKKTRDTKGIFHAKTGLIKDRDGKSFQLCPTLCDARDCSPLGISVHRISQARILECVAMSYSKGSSQLRD